MERWNGKNAVVTGASSGIGAAIAVHLANAGVCVVGLARRQHLVEELKTQVRGSGSIHSRQCDVSDLEQVAAAFKWAENKFGCIHILVNNAGIFINGYITDLAEGQLSDEQICSVMDTNVRATIMCTRRAISSMKKHSFDGHVVNINSVAGHYVPLLDSFNVYSSSKYAITAFTQSLLTELACLKSGIRITSISPGLVDTAMAAGLQNMPILKPADIADAVIYALSAPPTVNISELTIQPTSEKRL